MCVGVLLWQLSTGKEPFTEFSDMFALSDAVINGTRPDLNDPAFSGAPSGLTEIIDKCWAGNPRDRPPVSKLLEGLEKMLE